MTMICAVGDSCRQCGCTLVPCPGAIIASCWRHIFCRHVVGWVCCGWDADWSATFPRSEFSVLL